MVTGANCGLGLEFARQFLEREEKVFATCRNPDSARELHELKAAYPDSLFVVELDVNDAEAIARSEQFVRSQAERLDLLINNAGVYMARRHAAGEQPSEHPGTLFFDEALIATRFEANQIAIEANAFAIGANQIAIAPLSIAIGAIAT
ncbi:MAG: SDR family NAD(P)-dependent oxidoreductase [Pyrinomonadaceae bacterium]|nr:SDR family NAD(P)-dependent oxidoreductase [Pyrinomonadaceae bacterium]